MNLLFIGGTGNISTACVRLAAEEGHAVTVLTRGTRDVDLPASVVRVIGDAASPGILGGLAARGFDAVVDFVAFDAVDVSRDIEAFRGHVGQYVFISSASVYLKPPPHYVVTEETPLGNPLWEYARRKIEAEGLLRVAHRETGFPATIVAPSVNTPTAGPGCATASSRKRLPVVHRLRRGLELVTRRRHLALRADPRHRLRPGPRGAARARRRRSARRSTSPRRGAVWNQVHETIARVVGVSRASSTSPRTSSPASTRGEGRACWATRPGASCSTTPGSGASCRVPRARRLRGGRRASIAWLEANPARQRIDANETVERILAAWRRAMAAVEGA